MKHCFAAVRNVQRVSDMIEMNSGMRKQGSACATWIEWAC